jgi:hypothetical protein
LFWLVDSSLPQGYGVGLLLSTSTGVPSAIDLSQSWTQFPGLYVMVGQRPASNAEPAFASALRQLISSSGPNLRFAWLADATSPPSEWSPATVMVQQNSGASTGTISVPAQVVFGSYILGLSAGAVIELTGDGFSISGTGQFVFSLRSPSSVWALTAPPTVLPFTGANAGCILLNLALPQPDSSGVDDYTRLDTGFRFAVNDWTNPRQGLLLSLYYPVFSGVPVAGVDFNCSFDFALPLSAARTRLAFAAGTPIHASSYRSHLGYGVSLTPATQPSDAFPAGLAFHRRPGSLHDLPQDDPLYLGPIGTFGLTVGGAGSGIPAARLACGIAGTEYFGLPGVNGGLVSFTPGGSAFAWLLGAPPPPKTAPPQPSLTGLATAPWATVLPVSGQQVFYYAQPDDGAIYSIRNGGDASLIPYLVFLEVSAGSVAAGANSYPMVPYAGITDQKLAQYKELEAQVLSPVRRAAIQVTTSPGSNAGAVPAVTPQGLFAGFSSDLSTWNLLSLVSVPSGSGANPPSLAFNDLSGPFRQAVQTSQLFMVATDGVLLGQFTDLNYWITDAVLADLASLPSTERPPDSVLQQLRTAARSPQVGLTAFTTMLQGVLSSSDQQYIPIVAKYSVYFEIVIDTWRFRLSPALWQLKPDIPTVMIFKFAKSRLRDLVQDTASWTWQAVGEIGGSVATTRDIILGILDSAEEQTEGSAQPGPLDFFVNTICNDPAWMGVLFLNAQTPFGSMPQELRGLAGGMDADAFYAHHVGLSVTPVRVDTTSRSLSLGSSAFFGLIDYESLQDIAQTFDDFDFKVLLLQILFRNSAVSAFSGRIELYINRLFGDSVSLMDSTHYNNLILLGSYQLQQGQGHYVFASSTANTYSSRSHVLESVEIGRAQFNTLAATETDDKVRSRFLLWGRLRFHALAGFDAFSFGYTLNEQGARLSDGFLDFSGLAVNMNFAPSDATDKTFTFGVSDLAFDMGTSVARSTSLFARFPLKLTGLLRGETGQTPANLGYEPVETPLSQGTLSDGWYALVFALDLGTMGALASQAGLIVSVLAAWGPSEERAAINVGLQLPGSQTFKNLPAIEGVLQAGFQSMIFDAAGTSDTPPDPEYVLRFRHFYLRLLGWKFPPGQADIYLFGDPESARRQNGAIGWYAAYLKE